MAAELTSFSDPKLLEVYDILIKTYGERPLVPRREPMHELISTMLSHRTTQKNEALAYERMMDRFGSYEAVQKAPVAELTEAIAPANFAEAKAPNIQKTLKAIYDERGEYSIDFLNDLPVEEAMVWLDSLPGVGIKTASLVMLFCFAKPVLPVDTHVHRVSQRIGFIGPKVGTEAAHHLLLDMLPKIPFVLFNFHVANLKHGQQLCVWGTPKCGPCPLKHLCNWYQENVVKAQAAT
jgi:endonuclease-3